MQVILTEEEYLKLKNQTEADRQTYVKRIDVSLALQELMKDLELLRKYQFYGPEQWNAPFKKFIDNLG